jgi:hypothetical protein
MATPQSTTVSLSVEYREIPDFPGYFATIDGEIYSRMNGRFHRLRLWQRVKKQPYLIVRLQKNGRRHTRKVHRLVLEAFVGSRPPGHQCRHLDGNGRNNALSNLRWGTPADNAADMERHGTRWKGGKGQQHRVLTEVLVAEIRREHAGGKGVKTIARERGLPRTTVRHVVRRVTWKHVA